jgi:3-oxoadipate enol-lactonase
VAETPAGLPPGRHVDLPGRGRTWVHEADGPPGAPTLLLLHGWTATAALNWFTSIPTLAEHYRVLAIDHRGHGRGIRSSRPFRLEDCADDAAALARLVGADRVIPVGYSMGGPVAQLMWRRHRHLVDGVVLCATSRSFRSTPGERAVFGALGGLALVTRVAPMSTRRDVRRRLLERRFGTDEEARWAIEESMRGVPRMVVEAGREIGSFTSHEWIGDLDVPAAVVITERDTVVHPDRQRHLAEAIPGASVHPVAADHLACANATEVFVPALVEACASVVARSVQPSA